MRRATAAVAETTRFEGVPKFDSPGLRTP